MTLKDNNKTNTASKDKNKKQIFLFMIIIAATGLALGLSDSVFSNYFKDAYNIDAFQRGIIEFPREIPGILCVFIVSALAGTGNIGLAIIAQILSAAGLIVLGLFTPTFGVMLFMLFVNSVGMHMFMPLGDSIGLSLAEKGSFGTLMGKFNGVRTAFAMIAGILVFAGFRLGFFSFVTPIKVIFLVAAAATCVVLVCLILMKKADGSIADLRPRKFKIVFRKEYKLFYFMAILFGARKQIMYVYGPWVLIELLDFGADSMSILMIAGAGIGIFFLPAVGKWIDRYGTSQIIMIEAAVFTVIYFAYGFLSAGLSGGWFTGAGMVIVVAFVINIADRMTMQFGMVRTIYMKQIAVCEDDVMKTLSTGMALDHILSIASAFVCGFIWTEWGPQYVFVVAAILCALNFMVGIYIKKSEKV